jgi:glycosyltransferase involved in cell wall biosynthesis
MQALGIRWHGLRYHKRPSLPATVYDSLVGALCVAVWSRAYRLDVVHARTHVPAAMALIGRLLVRDRPLLVFDIRGLMVEEYEEAGRWRPGGLPSRVARTVENAAIKGAARIVILTNNARARLFNPDRMSIVHVIPCCADLEQISKSAHRREELRDRLGLRDATVMVYVGKFPSWSMPAAMADFFNAASDVIEHLHFLILTQSGGDEIRTELQRIGADQRSYTITSTPAPDVGAYLAASDFAISFIRPAPSTVGQSPTKLGEYLGAGLPVVYSAGIGDLDELMSSEVGIPVEEHSPDAHREAARAILGLLVDPRTREACHETAEQSLSLARVGVPRYLALYEALASQRALMRAENRRRRTAILDATN